MVNAVADGAWLAPSLPAFAVLGLVTGVYGSLIGAGGGFLIVPALLLGFGFDAAGAVSASLCAVFCNATSATAGYARARRLDLRTGRRLAAGAVAGALLGAALGGALRTEVFTGVFGALLVVIGAAIAARPEHPFMSLKARSRAYEAFMRLELKARRLTDAAGTRFQYYVDLRKGLAVSFGAGVISSLFGVGGGILIVPALYLWLNFPLPIAVSTSTLILAISSLAGALVYAAQGTVAWGAAAALSAGAIAGAQVGVALARRLPTSWCARLLSLALLGIGVRMIVLSAFGR